jgi:hypothetical protein
MNQLHRAAVDVEAFRAQIGEDAFEEAWAGGRSLMLNEAVAYALEDDASAPDPEPA